MKVITINVYEPVYDEFQRLAKLRKKSTSELIRDAMDAYLREQSREGHSLLDLEPLLAGQPLRPLESREEPAGEISHDMRR